MNEAPLILVTNDDGIQSEALWAAVEALAPLGEVFVVAPDRQWTGAGRSMPHTVTGDFEKLTRTMGGRTVAAYAVDASPALCVVHAMLEFLPRRPAVVVAGINYGENLGAEVSASGTVGAALEAATFGVPALAVSLEMGIHAHMEGNAGQDYTAARAFTRRFARHVLEYGLPQGVDALNVNVPDTATPETSWRLTRLSRHSYFVSTRPRREAGVGRPGYRVMENLERTERDADIYGMCIERVVTVTPLSRDLTSAVDFGMLTEYLQGED